MKHLVFFLALFVWMAKGEAKSKISNISKIVSGVATVLVVDEEGNPVPGLEMSAAFVTRWQDDPKKNGVVVRWGRTGPDGRFTVRGRTDVNRVQVLVGRWEADTRVHGGEGGLPPLKKKLTSTRDYYCSIGGALFEKRPGVETTEVRLVVRKKINPVPMHARIVDVRATKLVAFNKRLGFPDEVAFDLEVGDFCAPMGKGQVADFVFKIDRENPGEPVVRLGFANPHDGIQPIVLKGETAAFQDAYGPFEAPLEGYLPSLEWTCKSKSGSDWQKSNAFENRVPELYVFRVRTAVDEAGNLRSARCGKIEGGFRISVSDHGFEGIAFRYCYNPDGTRNLEADLEKNLAKQGRGEVRANFRQEWTWFAL